MRIPALVVVPLVLLALAGCQTEGERLSSAVSGLDGVATANPSGDQGATTGITVALQPTATLDEVVAAAHRWIDDAGDRGSTLSLSFADGSGSFTATTPADDRIDEVLGDWFALSKVGAVEATDDYGDVRVTVYPHDESSQLSPAEVAALAERVSAAAPNLLADTVTVRSGTVGVDSTTGDFDADVLRALDAAWRPGVEVDLTASSVPVLRVATAATDDAMYRAVLDAVPFSSGAVIQFDGTDGTIATLRAGTCEHDGDPALWAYWGGPKACG